MKKKRRYLKDLIPVDINKLVLKTGYFEIEIGGVFLSLAPERHHNEKYYVTMFRNHLRQPECWELSARPHTGRLKNGAQIPYSHDEVYYVLSGSRRFRHLFIDPETMMIGTRTDFYPDHNRAYPRGKAREANKSFREQAREMEKALFGEDRDEIYRWDQDHKKARSERR
jgi:hypothetical protein